MCKSLWDISAQNLLFAAVMVVVKHKWRESSGQIAMTFIQKKCGKGLFWTSLMLKVRRLSQLSAVSGIRLMAPELGPSCPSIIHGQRLTLQKLTGQHLSSSGNLSPCPWAVPCLPEWPCLDTWGPGQAWLCLPGPDLVLLCAGIQLPLAQAVPAHTHEVKSWLPVGILWPFWPKRELIRMLWFMAVSLLFSVREVNTCAGGF